MLYHQKIDIRMFDDRAPWERDVFVGMLIRQVEEDNERERIKQQEAKSQAASRAARRR